LQNHSRPNKQTAFIFINLTPHCYISMPCVCFNLRCRSTSWSKQEQHMFIISEAC
jgi:hypothetical protein